jgi:parallel beta-helix repeat protein
MTISVTLPPVLAQSQCPVFAADHKTHLAEKTFVVSTVAGLQGAMADVNRGLGTQILLARGIYTLNETLTVRQRGVTIRSESGNRDDVTLRGKSMRDGVKQIVVVEAADFTLADLTIGWARQHAVQVRGEMDADRPRFLNLRFADAGRQLLDVSWGDDHAKPKSDQGLVEGCLFEFTDGVAPNNYVGGIDARGTQGWLVRGNIFRGVRSPEQRLAKPAILFWYDAAHTVVERNIIYGSDRGIGLGLGDKGHIGGIIRNNMVQTVRDVGIGLEGSGGTLVANNTVLTSGYPNAVELRFEDTRDGIVQNNLANAAIKTHDDGLGRIMSHFQHADTA